MEIIHLVLGKANPARMNGVNKVVHELATRQALAGQLVSLWGITASLEHNYPERPFNTRLFKAAVHAFGLPQGMGKAIAALKPGTVMHIHGGFVPVFQAVSRLLKKHGIPFVFTPHGSYNTLALKKGALRKRIYLPLFERPLLRRASLVHLLGQSEQQGLENILPGKKQNLVPYGFEATHISNGSHVVDNNFFTIAFCGRTDVFTKGLDALLEGFAMLKKQHAHARLWIIGDGPEMPALKQMAESLHLGDAVTFWGAQYGGEKMALLRKADVFAHPSRNEGLPTAVLEAAAEGIACLVTTATNMGTYVSQYGAGIEIEATTGEQVAQGLGSLHEAWAQGTLPAYGSNARTMVQKAFAWKEILNRYEHMYTSII